MAKLKKKKSKRKPRFILKFLLIIGCIFPLCYVSYHYYKRYQKPQSSFNVTIPKPFYSFGIDVSHHQGEIDWKAVLTSVPQDTLISFIYCKATEGSDHIDKQWENNRKKLSGFSLPFGAYHFLSKGSSGEAQAKNFLKNWSKSMTKLPPVLDVEVEFNTDKELIATMKIWLETVEKASGLKPIIYTSYHFLETKFKNEFVNYPFWVAAYSKNVKSINDPRIIHWQYSEKGILSPIKEYVDFNYSKIKF
jgi:lysozyme